ncbi:MAG TPA: Gfo/Idh/MocA family oxidoreductase [Bryobacteraceae bacterium]|nr:Gfo/Idh/MocA family oxidoreductase [Bryobacteraceae bacterium]
MRVALIGYGRVAAVHARALSKRVEILSVCGPDQTKAEGFAEQHEIRHVYMDIKTALRNSDTAIICSPSSAHYEQAKEALLTDANVLVELPACTSSAEAADLARLAEDRHRVLQCAHTSRYLVPYQRITAWILAGALGSIRHVHYVRFIPLRTRSWTDDALLHHAAHPLDLFLHWFAALRPLACAARPGIPGAQDVSLVACTPWNAPAAISISYTSRLPETKMTVIGSERTIATDGFSYISSDDTGLGWQGEEQTVYESAIQEQDLSFLDACRGAKCGVSWDETIRLTNCITDFIHLWNR